MLWWTWEKLNLRNPHLNFRCALEFWYKESAEDWRSQWRCYITKALSMHWWCIGAYFGLLVCILSHLCSMYDAKSCLFLFCMKCYHFSNTGHEYCAIPLTIHLNLSFFFVLDLESYSFVPRTFFLWRRSIVSWVWNIALLNIEKMF